MSHDIYCPKAWDKSKKTSNKNIKYKTLSLYMNFTVIVSSKKKLSNHSKYVEDKISNQVWDNTLGILWKKEASQTSQFYVLIIQFKLTTYPRMNNSVWLDCKHESTNNSVLGI